MSVARSTRHAKKHLWLMVDKNNRAILWCVEFVVLVHVFPCLVPTFIVLPEIEISFVSGAALARVVLDCFRIDLELDLLPHCHSTGLQNFVVINSVILAI